MKEVEKVGEGRKKRRWALGLAKYITLLMGYFDARRSQRVHKGMRLEFQTICPVESVDRPRG